MPSTQPTADLEPVEPHEAHVPATDQPTDEPAPEEGVAAESGAGQDEPLAERVVEEPVRGRVAESVPGQGIAGESEVGQAEPVASQPAEEPTPDRVAESVPEEGVAGESEVGQAEPVAGQPAEEPAPDRAAEYPVGQPGVSATESVTGEHVASEPDRRTPGSEPELPDDIQYSDLDPEARRELRSLTKSVAELVGRHLVAAGRLIDDDPELALQHARFARSRAARVALVREAAGLTAYHAGEFAEALGELRAVRRMSGGQVHLPVMADCERALGRPERALELAAEAEDLPKDVGVELKIVAAGARRDLGQLDAAVVALQGPDLDPAIREPWSPRLFYAYADNLEAAGRTEDAIRWFLNAAEADLDEETDAAERAFALREAE